MEKKNDFFKESSKLEKFTALLNQNPDPSKILENKQNDNKPYLPISHVEHQLDQVFFGIWETTNFTWQVVANEIVGKIELRVFHPILETWITKTGAASVMIQQNGWAQDASGKRIKVNPLPSDVDAKIKNTLVKDFPHLKSECIKNAAKQLGKYFGRDLGRSETGSHESFAGSLSKALQPPRLRDDQVLKLVERVRVEGEDLIIKTCELFTVTEEQKTLLHNALNPEYATR